MAYIEWKKNVLDPIQGKEKKLTGALLAYIERARTNEMIDKTLAQKVIDSLVLLAVEDEDPEKIDLAVYSEHFEIPFMNATKAHIETELRAEGSEESVTLEKVGKVVDTERLFVAPYLPSISPKIFVRRCLEELITEQAQGSDSFWTEGRIKVLECYIQGPLIDTLATFICGYK